MGGLLIHQQLVSVRPLQELVEYYQCHSLKESFKQLDTTLKFPYKSRERATTRSSSRSSGNVWAQGCSPRPLPEPRCFLSIWVESCYPYPPAWTRPTPPVTAAGPCSVPFRVADGACTAPLAPDACAWS